MSTTFEKNLEWGREGENIVARYLTSRGHVVSPLAQYENHDKAPVLVLEDNGSLIHPDMTVFTKDRQVLFAEVKRKNRWVGPWPGRAERGQETGFNERHLRHYAQVSDRTGLDLWVFFVHEKQAPTGIYAQKLSLMIPHLRTWDGRDERTGELRDPKPIALFPQHCLRKLWDLDTVEPKKPPEPLGEIRLPPRKPEPQGNLF